MDRQRDSRPDPLLARCVTLTSSDRGRVLSSSGNALIDWLDRQHVPSDVAVVGAWENGSVSRLLLQVMTDARAALRHAAKLVSASTAAEWPVWWGRWSRLFSRLQRKCLRIGVAAGNKHSEHTWGPFAVDRRPSK